MLCRGFLELPRRISCIGVGASFAIAVVKGGVRVVTTDVGFDPIGVDNVTTASAVLYLQSFSAV